jgi:hypothetical protein
MPRHRNNRRDVPKGDVFAKARTQLQAEPVLRLAEDKARGHHPGYAWKAQRSFACARASGPSAVNLCGAARDQQPPSSRMAARAAPVARRRLRLPMPIVRMLLVLLALASPALAQVRPDVAALLGRVFDLGALNALPPAQASDLPWLLDWMEAANAVNKLFTRYGSKPGPQPDLPAIERNMTEYEDQFAAALNFLIRGQAREAVSSNLFWQDLAPEQRTRIREQGFAGARNSSAEFILSAVCSAITSGGKPANARLVSAAIRDTGEVWASYFLPQHRSRILEQLADYTKRVPDETARTDLAAFAAALQAKS